MGRKIIENGTAEETQRLNDSFRNGVSPAAEKPDAPRDPFGFVAFTVFLFGIASLLPWNFFITAQDYWDYKFRDVNNTNMNNTNVRTALQNAFPSYLAIASKVPYILFLGVNTAISARVRTSLRIGWPLFGCTLLFIVTTVLVKINTDDIQYTFLAITLTLVVLINVVAGFFQGGGTGLAGCFPARYMAINVLGQAFGGVFATVCQILTLLLGLSSTNSALIYFLIATVTLIITQICFGILVQTDFYKHYTSLKEVHYEAFDQDQKEAPKTPFWQIFLNGWHFYLSVVLIFWVTLAVFPAITVKVQSSHADSKTPLATTYFLPLACFLLFNVADLVGRFIAKYFAIPAAHRWTVLGLSIARIAFIPLMLFCNIPDRHVLPTLFPHDWQYMTIMTAFGISNGYITTLALTYASKASAEEHQETAGSLAAVFLGLGLMLGSVSSYGTIQLV